MLIEPPAISTESGIIDTSITDITNDNLEEQKVLVKKKRQYRAFVRLVKNGQFTTAVMSAKVLGVHRVTIAEWLQTPKVRAIMDATLNTYIRTIEANPDWKAKAYLLDKLTQEDKPSTAIQINNTIDTVKAKYNI